MNLKEKVIAEIKKIYDPEIPVNIYELGLIYDISVNDNKVKVKIDFKGLDKRIVEIPISESSLDNSIGFSVPIFVFMNRSFKTSAHHDMKR